MSAVSQPSKRYGIDELQQLQLQAAYTIGAEAGNVINVAAQLKDGQGANLAKRVIVDFYLADANTGAAIITTAPSGGYAIGTNGAILVSPVANKLSKVVTNATGQFDINITEAGAKTLYLVLVLPDGSQQVSAAITFV